MNSGCKRNSNSCQRRRRKNIKIVIASKSWRGKRSSCEFSHRKSCNPFARRLSPQKGLGWVGHLGKICTIRAVKCLERGDEAISIINVPLFLEDFFWKSGNGKACMWVNRWILKLDEIHFSNRVLDTCLCCKIEALVSRVSVLYGNAVFFR